MNRRTRQSSTIIGATLHRALTLALFELSLAAGVVEFILGAGNLSVNKHNVYMYVKEKEETWDEN